MCGISAVVALDGFQSCVCKIESEDYRSKLSNDLDESLEYIKHRGPDAKGKWISDDNSVALGHVRLATNDLRPSGDQPFMNPERTVFAVVNGELYDHEATKASLPEPYSLKGNSDCEIGVALYLQYGISFLSKLRGEFSLCFRYIGRSKVGDCWWQPEWDVSGLMENGWIFDNRTIFKDAYKVRPGHYLVCKGSSQFEQRQYWDLEFPDKRNVEPRSEGDMIQGLRKRLLEAVRLRLKADVPIGVFLSGGIDSSVIAGMMTQLVEKEAGRTGTDPSTARRRVTAFNVEFEGDEFSEARERPNEQWYEACLQDAAVAERTAEFLGIKLEKALLNEQVYANHFEDAFWHAESHFPDLNAVGKFAVSKLAHERGYKVILSGEGSDEHFGGYPTVLPDFLREADESWPLGKWEDDERDAKREHLERNTISLLKGSDQKKEQGSSVVRRMLNVTSIAGLTSAQMPPMDFAPWTANLAPMSAQETIANNIDARAIDLINTRWHPLHTAHYVWIKGFMQSAILSCVGDRQEMASSVETGPPFLDHELTAYANTIPPSLKIRRDPETGEFTEKWILREAAKPFILDELYMKKKKVFMAPITFTENGPLRRLLDQLITKDNVERLGFVDWQRSKSLTAAAFGPQNDQLAMRKAFVVAQWVSLGRRFGVRNAMPLNHVKENGSA